MKWKGRRQSTNVEDQRRGLSGKKSIFGGGIGTIILIVVMLIAGKNPMQMLQMLGGEPSTEISESQPSSAEEDEAAAFVKVVLADTEEIWSKIFNEAGSTYRKPKLVLFRNSVESGCGSAASSIGPFYCSADEKIYIDLSFYDELHNRFNAPGDFAMAYVIAHEVGHHVQHLMGTSAKVHSMKRQLSESEYNKMSVKLELQAYFYAGLWAHYADRNYQVLEEGDIEEALNAANAIGDDRLQKQVNGYVVPDAFTHGTSEQRMRWFKKGYTTGVLSEGNTFATNNL